MPDSKPHFLTLLLEPGPSLYLPSPPLSLPPGLSEILQTHDLHWHGAAPRRWGAQEEFCNSLWAKETLIGWPTSLPKRETLAYKSYPYRPATNIATPGPRCSLLYTQHTALGDQTLHCTENSVILRNMFWTANPYLDHKNSLMVLPIESIKKGGKLCHIRHTFSSGNIWN